MGVVSDPLKLSLVSAAFVLAGGLSSSAQAQNLTSPMPNYYLGNGQVAQCTLIDGRGASSDSIRNVVQELRSTLTRFPSGATAVADMASTETALCFTPGAVENRSTGVRNEAEYKHEQNMMLLSGTNAGYFMHEWKHKHDGIDFDSFEMTPHTAVLALRFAEAGAYAYEAMSRHEARENGVDIPAPQRGSMMDRMVNVYDETLASGGNQEQAWRNAFDLSFQYNLKNIQTANVLQAYEQALQAPDIRNRSGFAQTTLTSDFLKQVALPPGWDVGVFDRTGGGLILGDQRYVDYQADDAERLRNIQTQLNGPR